MTQPLRDQFVHVTYVTVVGGRQVERRKTFRDTEAFERWLNAQGDRVEKVTILKRRNEQ
jgi:hypothetical protein